MAILLLGALLCAAAAVASTGVDVSARVYQSDWSCMVSNGVSFAIVRGYQSFGQVDPSCAATVADAWAAGVSHVDVYM